MADTLTPQQRSEHMGRVRGKDTKPEFRVRRLLHALGFRYRLHRKDLPGRPDIVLPAHRVVVHVHGCYWHGCPHCAKGRKRPASNAAFWNAKLDRNKERDAEVDAALRALGWEVFTVWECRTAKAELLVHDLAELIVRRVGQDKVPDSGEVQGGR